MSWDDRAEPSEPLYERFDTTLPVAPEIVADPSGEVRRELDALRNPASSWGKAVTTLVVSVALFAAMGLFNNPVANVLMIIGVLFVHELGHYLGMRLFGYRNVRMFFIPLFGAAVSGRRTGVESCKEAIVSLLGPVPGLCVGLVLLGLSVMTRDPLLWPLAVLLVLINGFNLLPIFPLDGGRFLQVVLFSRNRYLETTIQALAGVALVALGVAMQAWVLAILGGFVLVGCGVTFKTSRIAASLRGQWAQGALGADDEIPEPLLAAMVADVRGEFSAVAGPKRIAGLVLQVWDKLRTRPPDLGQSLALLLVYGFFLAATFVVPIAILVLRAWLAAGAPAGAG